MVLHLPGSHSWLRFRRGGCLGDEAKARRRVAEQLQRPGWSAAELAERRQGDAEKAAPARRLRTETTMSWPCIAKVWHLGRWTHISNLLDQKPRKSVKSEG